MPFSPPPESNPKPDPFIGSDADRKQLQQIENAINADPRGRELMDKVSKALGTSVNSHKDLARRVGANPNVQSFTELRTQYWAAVCAENGMTPQEFYKLSDKEMFALLELIARKADQEREANLTDAFGTFSHIYDQNMVDAVIKARPKRKIKSRVAPVANSLTRSSWLDAKLDGKYGDTTLGAQGTVTFKPIAAWRRGKTNARTPQTRKGISDALNKLGISCAFSEVPE